jgi:hypothetical protein
MDAMRKAGVQAGAGSERGREAHGGGLEAAAAGVASSAWCRHGGREAREEKPSRSVEDGRSDFLPLSAVLALPVAAETPQKLQGVAAPGQLAKGMGLGSTEMQKRPLLF